MRKQYNQILKKQFRESLIHTREDLTISQEEMVYRLLLSCWTYAELERGRSCLGALTLAIYIIRICPEFVNDLRSALEIKQEVTAR